MAHAEVSISKVSGKADFDAFIDLAYRLNAGDANWVPPLRDEVVKLLTPGKNPFHEHADMQLFLARRGDAVVGRISAHIDHLALTMPVAQGMGPGTGNWGLFEAEDEEGAKALIAAAEGWLKSKGMTRVLAPISLSIWEEPGLLTKGHDHPAMVMMGHDAAAYQPWIEGAGYLHAKTLATYDLDITGGFPPLIQRIVQSGEKSSKINIRRISLKHFDRVARIILNILNDAWSDNWGFVPITEAEIVHISKELKPLVREDLIMIAELEGEPVAFMMTLPDLNQPIHALGARNGKPSPLGWLKLLWWLRKPKNAQMRVPLMGVLKRLQASRLASQLAFMMIEYIRVEAIARYNSKRAEIGWVLDDNQGMNAIADAIQSKVNKEYTIYQKAI